MPSTGALVNLAFPSADDQVRVDTGVREGDVISPHYDPMIAKVIAHGADREQALARLSGALAQTHIVGVRNNVQFLRAVLATESFASADLDTALLEREASALSTPLSQSARDERILVAVANELAHEKALCRARSAGNPWDIGDGWRMNGHQTRAMSVELAEERVVVTVDYLSNGARLSFSGRQCVVRSDELADGARRFELNGQSLKVKAVVDGTKRHLFGSDWRETVEIIDPLAVSEITEQSSGELTAPMPGKVIALAAKPGQAVKQGEPLLVLEAMKMEHTISAPSAGKLVAFRFAVGDQVQEGVELADFEPTGG
jgi:3-methylcrotonyl-CoA carboxylase alpha subunit